MCDESKRFAVVLNVQIYDFRALRKSIERDFNFFSNYNTEVILRLFQKHRENASPFSNGLFAIAIVDDRTNDLFLARDHVVIKPVFYTRDNQRFLFASEPRALLPHLSSTELDHE